MQSLDSVVVVMSESMLISLLDLITPGVSQG